MISHQSLASLVLPAGPREKLSFNAGWRFIQADIAGAEAVDFDDGAWETVGVPHTFNETDTFDDWSPSGHRGEMNQWGGVVWYRKHFNVPPEWSDRRVHIEFEGVRQTAEVWVNGSYLGRSDDGFIPFGFDLGPHLLPGRDNVIAVRVDNSFATDNTSGVPITHPNEGEAKYPWNNPHWHPAHGGIYRNVYLHVAGAVHVTLPFYGHLGTTGLYVHSKEISAHSARVTVEAEVLNRAGAAGVVEVLTRLRDADGSAVAEWTQAVSLEADAAHTFKGSAVVDQPRLWEPGHPYLYTAEVIVSFDGAERDGAATRFGIRRVVFNRETGFFINDRAVKLEGWGQKPTNEWAGLGSALPDWMQYFTLEQMREAGANFIRWGHCAGGPGQIAAGDQLGLVTLQPGVDGEKDAEGEDWRVRAAAFRDMIVYYRNAPSILIWEGGNQSVSLDHVQELRGYADQFDPHGGRAYAQRRANSVVEPFLDISIGTEGSGFLSSLPVVEGEYNREEAPRRVWDRQTPPYENYQAEGSYDLTAEEYAINQATQYEKIAPGSHGGGANWIYSDSTSGGRVTSEVTRTSGEVDAVRLPKEAYHVTRVIFRRERPDLHIVGHWNYPAGTVKTVWVAANRHEVELFLNGRSLGRQTADGSSPFLFRFDDVAFEPGELVAVLYDAEGREAARHGKETAGPATALRLTPITGPEGFLADGTDVALFDVEAVDEQGRRNPVWNGRVDFELAGPAIWRGGYNSGRIDSTNHPWLHLESGINRVAIRSSGTAGPVALTASAAELAPHSVTVDAAADPAALAAAPGITRTLPPIPAPSPLQPLPAPPPQDKIDSEAGADEPPEPAATRFFRNLAYSGPGGEAAVRAEVAPGLPVYTDADTVFTGLPSKLAQGERIAFPLADRAFSAVDLMQVEIVNATPLFLLHDAALTAPQWLEASFQPTDLTATIGERMHRVFRRQAEAGDTVLLGSNQEGVIDPNAQMYTLIATGNDLIRGSGGPVDESAQRVAVELTRSGASTGERAAQVDYETREGSALAGRDFEAASGSLNWAAGAVGTRSFEIGILNNAQFVGDRTFSVRLSSPTPDLALPPDLSFRIIEDERPVRADRPLAAGDATLEGGAAMESNHDGYTGEGFINLPTSAGIADWSGIDGGLGGPSQLVFRYALDDLAGRTVELELNDEPPREITFEASGAWDVWTTKELTVDLLAGSGNRLRLRTIGEDGPNLDSVRLRINESMGALPVIEEEPGTPVADAGKSLNLSLGVREAGGTEYLWYRDGERIGTTSAPSFMLEAATFDNVGDYWVELRNTSGSVNTRTFRPELRLTDAYAFGDASGSGAMPPVLQDSGNGQRTLLLPHGRADLDYRLESSERLGEGSWASVSGVVPQATADGGLLFPLPAVSAEAAFFRIRAAPDVPTE